MEELPVTETPFELEADSGVTEQKIRGEVERVLYESSDSSYSVLAVKCPDGDIVTVIGSMPGIAAGQGIAAAGRWEQHKDYGRQFRALSYEYTLPVTPEGITRYLSSGVVKGLGKKYAEAIVRAFGTNTLDVIENAPLRLKEVPGLGSKRIEAVKKAWKANAALRNLQIHLQSYGISQAYFSRIYKLYGDRSAELLKENPYRLASDIPGIGFLMADRIAEKMGIGKDSPKRLLSGVSYVLLQLRGAGHVCLPLPLFLDKCSEILNIDRDAAEKALSSAISLMTVCVRKSKDGTEMVYDPAMLRCEEEFPALLARLASVQRYAGQNLLRFPVRKDAVFSEEQLSAVKAAGSNPISIITGGPGVGKTTVVGEIVRRAKLAKLSLYLAAPTGRAAKRMSETTGIPASTIHRLLKWDPEKHAFIHGRKLPLNCQLLIVDETSMLDLLLATALFRAVSAGTTVVIVGDSDQLPSVGPGNVLNDLIESRLLHVTRLTKIFRQGAGSGIIYAAHDVNDGRLPRMLKPDSSGVTDFYWIEKEDGAEAADLIERMVADRIPARFHLNPMTDIQVLTPMNRGSCGTAALNEKLQAVLNPDAKLAFKFGDHLFRLGDKVMQISNNYDKGVFNGDMGRIQSINHGEKKFTVKFDSEAVVYDFIEADQIVLSYAVTIHKSQGSEFPAVVMPMLTQHFMMLQRNLLYTGMTRAKKLMILVAPEKAVSMAVRNFVREPRYSLLGERLLDAFAKENIFP